VPIAPQPIKATFIPIPDYACLTGFKPFLDEQSGGFAGTD